MSAMSAERKTVDYSVVKANYLVVKTPVFKEPQDLTTRLRVVRTLPL